MIKELYDRCNKHRNENRKLWRYEYKVCKLWISIMYPFIQSFNNRKGISEDGEVIVSLASIPARVNKVWITISSIMNQTKKPKKILLNLAEDLFPNGEKDLPKSVLRMKARGLEIRFVEDLAPHKKYLFTMRDYPEDIVVTMDDDVFYPEDTLEKLINKHNEYPDAVCCMRGHLVVFDENGNFAKYDDWNSEEKGLTTPSILFFPIGNGGVLYPPHCMDDNLFNINDIKELTLYNDDIWLKMMELLKGTMCVRAIPDTLIFFTLIGSKKSSLFIKNTTSRNNELLNKVVAKYPRAKEVLYNEWKTKNNNEK